MPEWIYNTTKVECEPGFQERWLEKNALKIEIFNLVMATNLHFKAMRRPQLIRRWCISPGVCVGLISDLVVYMPPPD